MITEVDKQIKMNLWFSDSWIYTCIWIMYIYWNVGNFNFLNCKFYETVYQNLSQEKLLRGKRPANLNINNKHWNWVFILLLNTQQRKMCKTNFITTKLVAHSIACLGKLISKMWPLQVIMNQMFISQCVTFVVPLHIAANNMCGNNNQTSSKILKSKLVNEYSKRRDLTFKLCKNHLFY